MRYAIGNGFVAVDVEEILPPRDTEEVVRIVERARAEGKHVEAVGDGYHRHLGFAARSRPEQDERDG